MSNIRVEEAKVPITTVSKNVSHSLSLGTSGHSIPASKRMFNHFFRKKKCSSRAASMRQSGISILIHTLRTDTSEAANLQKKTEP